MWNCALLVLALGDVEPELLHAGAVVGHGTLAVVVRTLGGVPEQEQPLLLVKENLPPVLLLQTAGRLL